MLINRKFAGLLALTLLAGCQSSTTLPNGETSRMGDDFNTLRAGFAVAPQAVSLPSYQPISSCQYTLAITPPGGGVINQTVNITAKPVAGDTSLLEVIETTAAGAVSVYLIKVDSGALVDFNAIDPITGQRYTPEDSDAMAQSAIANLPNAQYVQDPHYLNGFSLFMPHFTGSVFNVNDVVSDVNEEDGTSWAQYLYRGTVTYQGVTGDLFDLMRSVPGAGSVLVGFMIFDSNTMTPVISTLDSGTEIQFDRIQCAQ